MVTVVLEHPQFLFYTQLFINPVTLVFNRKRYKRCNNTVYFALPYCQNARRVSISQKQRSKIENSAFKYTGYSLKIRIFSFVSWIIPKMLITRQSVMYSRKNIKCHSMPFQNCTIKKQFFLFYEQNYTYSQYVLDTTSLLNYI